MASITGKNIKVSLFGQSHSPEIGVVIDGLPAGLRVDIDELQEFMNRRAPGKQPWATARKEPDQVEIVTGLHEGFTCGAPLMARIVTSDARSKSYVALADTPRPGHADFPAEMKFQGYQDKRGGGHFSGRITAALCIAGGIALQLLSHQGIYVGAHIARVHGIDDVMFNPVSLTREELQATSHRTFPVLNEAAGEAMKSCIMDAQSVGDSVGGVIECAAIGLPAGIGEPHFEGIENHISTCCFAIPGIKGIEFGDGFSAADLFGSQNNDSYRMQGEGIYTETNHAGGILGGLSTGMPVVFRVAVKPTPSIARLQKTINMQTKEDADLTITGRHDPCIVPRAVPVVEAAAALALYDLVLSSRVGGAGYGA